MITVLGTDNIHNLKETLLRFLIVFLCVLLLLFISHCIIMCIVIVITVLNVFFHTIVKSSMFLKHFSIVIVVYY